MKRNEQGFLTIKNGKIVLEVGKTSTTVTSVTQFNQLMVDKGLGSLLFSSTMDFPGDFTKDPETIALAKALRS